MLAHAKETVTANEKKKDLGYNVRQSKIAIGSGRIFGKGLLKATQTRYDFVPEQRTDFIFLYRGRRVWIYRELLIINSIPGIAVQDCYGGRTTAKYI